MKIPYKYQIGQKVIIDNNKNNSTHWSRDEYITPLIGKEVTIIDRGFELEDVSDKFRAGYGKKPNFLDKYHLTIFYYIDSDPWIEYTKEHCAANTQLTRINETCLFGEELGEPIEEEFKTEDNYDVNVSETKVLEHIIGRFIDSTTWKPYEEVNCGFTFASYGTVIGLRKNYKLTTDSEYLKKCPKRAFEVETFREFLCFYEPRSKNEEPCACGDARAYGNKHWVSIDDIWKNLPENFVERYVNDALNRPFNKTIKYDPFKDWDTEQWLKKLEIYDKVKKLFNKQMPKFLKEEVKKQEALQDFIEDAKKYLAKLTPEQKEKLKQML